MYSFKCPKNIVPESVGNSKSCIFVFVMMTQMVSLQLLQYWNVEFFPEMKIVM